MRISKIIILLLLFFCLCGCSKQQRPACNVVTQIDITCTYGNQQLQRCYTDSEKMQAVLLYMRLLRNDKTADTAAQPLAATDFQITVSMSDGTKRFYHQKDYRFFQKNDGGWQRIPPEQAMELYRLIHFYDSDV